ncbi:MAG: acyl carrier protein [Ruminococcaceae bacterium]|nr:acyl carrier protein [Oscillospiraceae bacterium]MBQ8897237.1 acyl carrier protein [Clostridia bacterium]
MVFEKIRAIICDKFALEESAVTPETSFVEDLSADSLDMVEVIMALEEEFEIGEISEDALASIKTVGDAANFISAQLK